MSTVLWLERQVGPGMLNRDGKCSCISEKINEFTSCTRVTWGSVILLSKGPRPASGACHARSFVPALRWGSGGLTSCLSLETRTVSLFQCPSCLRAGHGPGRESLSGCFLVHLKHGILPDFSATGHCPCSVWWRGGWSTIGAPNTPAYILPYN